MVNHPFLKVLDTQRLSATKATRAAMERETAANAEFLAAMEVRDNAAKALQEARHEHSACEAHAKGIQGLKKLLGSGDSEIIQAVLGSPDRDPQGEIGWRCQDAKYAAGKCRGHGALQWNATARYIQRVYATLVGEGHLPPLPELLNKIKEAK